MGRVEGQIALVTGGSRGIGFAIAQAFLAEGATVVITGRDPEQGETAAGELGERASFVRSDVTVRGSIEGLIDDTVRRHGQLDCLVNNAGGPVGMSALVDMTDESWDATLTLNLTSVFWATRRALVHMTARRTGCIINISSLEGKVGQPALGHYVAAKHGLHGLTKATAHEVGQLGITANAICPGLVLTDLVTGQLSAASQAMGITTEQVIATFVERGALKRPVTEQEVAAVAVMLAAPEGKAITGTTISVDGGVATW